MQVTILYCSSNAKDPEFTQRIRDNTLKHCGGLPIVSVTQQPLDFGRNICVGQHRNCYYNEYRQVQIGLRAIDTEYVLVAEDDCLYPPEYFRLDPQQPGRLYRYRNVWVVYAAPTNPKPRYHYKGVSDCSQMIGRQLWLSQLDEAFEGMPDWQEDEVALPIPRPMRTDPCYTWTGNPVVTFKTKSGVTLYTNTDRSVRPGRDLPYWGPVLELRERMFGWRKDAAKQA